VRMGTSAELVGKTIGRYKIVQPLNGFGMGRAFLARHLSLGTDVLFKVIPSRVADDSISFHAFKSIIAGMTKFPHSAIPLVQEVIQEQGLTAYTVPYESGQTLAARLVDGKPIPLPDFAKTFRTACEALAVVHRAGYVHRAIRPTSLLVSESSGVKLIDFGVQMDFSRLDGEAGSSALEAAAYISPEDSQKQAIGPAADLYSLGATMFTALTGVPPFRGRDPASIVDAHLNIPAPTPTNLRPDLPPALGELVMRLLAKRPADRPRDAHEVQAAIDRAIPRSSATARQKPVPSARRAIAKRSPPEGEEGGRSPVRRKSSTAVPFLAIGGILLAVVALVVTLGGRAPRRASPPSDPSPPAGAALTDATYRQNIADARAEQGKGNLSSALGLAQQARALKDTPEVQELIDALQTELSRLDREQRARPEFEKLMELKAKNPDPMEVAFACDEFIRLYGDCPQAAEIRKLRESMIALHRERLAKGPTQPPTPTPGPRPVPTPNPNPTPTPGPTPTPDPPPPPPPASVPEIAQARELIAKRDHAGARKLLVEALKKHPTDQHAAIGRELAKAILFESGRWTSRFNGRKLEDDFFPVRLSGSDIKIAEGTNEITGFSSDDRVAMLMFKKFDPAVDNGVMAEFRLDKKLYDSHAMGFRFEVKGGNVYKEFTFDLSHAAARTVEPGGAKELASRRLGRVGGQWVQMAMVEEGGLTLGFLGGELVFALPVDQLRIAADMRLYLMGCEGRMRNILVRN